MTETQQSSSSAAKVNWGRAVISPGSVPRTFRENSTNSNNINTTPILITSNSYTEYAFLQA